MHDNDTDLVITQSIGAPRAAVWRAWSDPALLAEWWCPKPWRTEVRAFEFRPGGAFDTLMLGPDGEQSDNAGSFLEIVPQQRIVFTSALSAGWRPAEPWLAMTAIVTLEEAPGGIRYAARVLHRNAEDRERHAALGFAEGWGICIRQLEALAQQLAS